MDKTAFRYMTSSLDGYVKRLMKVSVTTFTGCFTMPVVAGQDTHLMVTELVTELVTANTDHFILTVGGWRW